MNRNPVNKIPISVLLLLLSVVCATPVLSQPAPAPPAESTALTISRVGVESKPFNPTRGEVKTIFYQTSMPAKVSVKIFDPGMFLVRELLLESPGSFARVPWDGKDQEGNIVPDEAYFFTVEATDYGGNFVFYDPLALSGVESFEPEVVYDPERRSVTYKLEKDARVRVRAGIASGGPLLKNIVPGIPQVAGPHEQPWDGMDESGVVEATSQKGFTLTAEATTLPENSLITEGNTAYDYVRYRYEMVRERPKKIERPPPKTKGPFPDQRNGGPRQMCPDPKLHLELPKNVPLGEKDLPILQGKVPIRIYLDDKIKKYVTEQRYELLFFVDFKFISEIEEGHSPVNWLWDTSKVGEGEHIFSVNVATLTGQVGCAHLKLLIRR
jgi:flagellar hook assembly protein FlgD